MKVQKIITFFLFVGMTVVLSANTNCGYKYYYVNGMFAKYTAERSKEKVWDELKTYKAARPEEPAVKNLTESDVRLAYNHDEGHDVGSGETVWDQLLEVYKQKLADNGEEPDFTKFVLFAAGIMSAENPVLYDITGLQEALAEVWAARFNAVRDSYFGDEDLDTHVAAYREEINNGSSVVLVAHSQGNFYANFAYDRLYRIDTEPIAPNALGIVAVATPASRVRGIGERSPYVTFHQDFIINRVSELYPATLPSRLPLRDDGGEWMCHGFAGVYMNPLNESRWYIVSELIATAHRLKIPECPCAFEVAINNGEPTCYDSDTFERIGYTGSSSFPYGSYTFHVSYDDVSTSWTACRHCTNGWSNSSGDRLEIGNGAGGRWVHGGIDLYVNVVE